MTQADLDDKLGGVICLMRNTYSALAELNKSGDKPHAQINYSQHLFLLTVGVALDHIERAMNCTEALKWELGVDTDWCEDVLEMGK